jgi:hypothetical protein
MTQAYYNTVREELAAASSMGLTEINSNRPLKSILKNNPSVYTNYNLSTSQQNLEQTSKYPENPYYSPDNYHKSKSKNSMSLSKVYVQNNGAQPVALSGVVHQQYPQDQYQQPTVTVKSTFKKVQPQQRPHTHTIQPQMYPQPHVTMAYSPHHPQPYYSSYPSQPYLNSYPSPYPMYMASPYMTPLPMGYMVPPGQMSMSVGYPNPHSLTSSTMGQNQQQVSRRHPDNNSSSRKSKHEHHHRQQPQQPPIIVNELFPPGYEPNEEVEIIKPQQIQKQNPPQPQPSKYVESNNRANYAKRSSQIVDSSSRLEANQDFRTDSSTNLNNNSYPSPPPRQYVKKNSFPNTRDPNRKPVKLDTPDLFPNSNGPINARTPDIWPAAQTPDIPNQIIPAVPQISKANQQNNKRFGSYNYGSNTPISSSTPNFEYIRKK